MTSRLQRTLSTPGHAGRRLAERSLVILLAFAMLIGVFTPAPGLSAARAKTERPARADKKSDSSKGTAESARSRKGHGTKSAPKKSAPARSTSKKGAAKQGAAKKVTTKKATSKKITSRKVTPKKASSRIVGTKKGKAASTARTSRKATSPRRAASESSSRYAPRFFDPDRPQTLKAEAAVVIDTRTMKVVWAKNAHAQRSVASLTKLMTTLVVLDHAVDLADSMTVTMDDVKGAGHSHVRAGNRVAIGDLLRCSLISSDNCATRVLARSTGLSIPEFVVAMNAKARALDLRETHYADPTGLDANNLSTAADQARLIIIAADNPLISRITSSPSYTFLCGRRIESLTNTNRLLRSRSDIVGSKTGFISQAGYCLAMLVGDRDNPYLTTVVLGAPSNASRFAESSKLIEWALSVVGPPPAMASPIPSRTAPAQPNQPNRR